jgi:hypothetical protein
MKKYLKRFIIALPIIIVLEYIFVTIPELMDYLHTNATQCLHPELVPEACTKAQALRYGFNSLYSFNKANFGMLTIVIALLIPVVVLLLKRLREQRGEM